MLAAMLTVAPGSALPQCSLVLPIGESAIESASLIACRCTSAEAPVAANSPRNL